MGVYCMHKVKHTAQGNGLSEGGAYIYRIDTQTIVREVALFLYDEYHLKLGSVLTQVNVSNSIWQWLEFNAAAGLDWKEADIQLLLDYRDLMMTTLSPRTGRPYASGTVSARMISVIMLYRYLQSSKILLSDIAGIQSNETGLCWSGGAQFSRKGQSFRKSKGYIPKEDGRLRIAPFSRKHLQSILNAIGPRASLKEQSDSRDRLIVDFGWAVGLRNSEITGLRTSQFINLHPDPNFPGDNQRLEVLGKRKKRRVVAVPNWLVLDAQAYIKGERTEALLRSRDGVDSEYLLVSSKKSRFPGRKISTRRTLQIVEAACLLVGQVETVSRNVPGRGNVYTEKATHCVHDLRHTYAVMTYHAEVSQGNREPWKKIQAQLGHKNLQTTIDTYLHYVSVFDLE